MKKLDLHGLRHKAAREAVIKFLEDNWGAGIEVQIVTGHSARMREIVKVVLSEYNLDYQLSFNGGHYTTWLE